MSGTLKDNDEELHRLLCQRIESGCLGMHIGDSLAFPLHWYYSATELRNHLQQFYDGKLSELVEVPPELKLRHPDSWKYYQKYGVLMR
jgi:hypothetical protein